jgi:hypothetical protein
MKKRRRMTAKQLKYFGKRKRKAVSVKTYKPRRKRNMAKRYSRVKRYASKGIGGMKGMIAPIVGGVADSYLDPMLPIDGVGATAVGMFMHNNTLKEIGLYKVGFSLGNILPLPGRSGTVGNGGML